MGDLAQFTDAVATRLNRRRFLAKAAGMLAEQRRPSRQHSSREDPPQAPSRRCSIAARTRG